MGKKLRLELDALEVESFEAGTAESLRGTVHGRTGESCTCPTNCGYCLDTDPGEYGVGEVEATKAKYCTNGATCQGVTCKDASCGPNTCYESCQYTWCNTVPCGCF